MDHHSNWLTFRLLGERPTEANLFPLQVILGLIISNGVGTISAQGCKGAVSADGPDLRSVCRSTRA